jgi:hypothetical protein
MHRSVPLKITEMKKFRENRLENSPKWKIRKLRAQRTDVPTMVFGYPNRRRPALAANLET